MMAFEHLKTLLQKLWGSVGEEPETFPELTSKITIALLTWEEDKNEPCYARSRNSESKINGILKNYNVIPFLIPTRKDVYTMINETASFLKQCEEQMEPDSYLLICYVGRHVHYTHGFNLQPLRYDPDAFHYNDVMRDLQKMVLQADYLESEAAVDATRLHGTLEWENRVPALYYLKKKYAPRDILCLGALHSTKTSAEPLSLERIFSTAQQPGEEVGTALEVALTDHNDWGSVPRE